MPSRTSFRISILTREASAQPIVQKWYWSRLRSASAESRGADLGKIFAQYLPTRANW